MPWMHLRAFSHDSDIWFSSQYDWQISAFGAKAGRDDRWYELQTSSDHQFETAQLSVSRFHSFIQLGLWLWCFTGVRLGHKVVLCLPWGIPESQKKKKERMSFKSSFTPSLCLNTCQDHLYLCCVWQVLIPLIFFICLLKSPVREIPLST